VKNTVSKFSNFSKWNDGNKLIPLCRRKISHWCRCSHAEWCTMWFESAAVWEQRL